MAKLVTDAPTSFDLLGRQPFAKRLSEIITTSETPITIGVYGPWGCGKTSLLYMTQDIIKKNTKSKTVWFSAWQHQNAENIIIPLLQTVRTDWENWSIKEGAHKFFTILGSTVGDIVLKSVTSGGVSAQSIIELGEKYEQDYFRAKSVSYKIQQEFGGAVSELLGSENNRLVIFIDDIDRCTPDKALEILESLKIYLSVRGVVFVLAADADVISRAIGIRYGDIESSEHSRNYLDKLVQMSIDIPEPNEDKIKDYCTKLMGDLHEAKTLLQKQIPLIASSLDKNPRRIKKLFNSLSFVWDLVPHFADDEAVGKLVDLEPRHNDMLLKIPFNQDRFSFYSKY